MNYVSREESILFQCSDFQISETLECGQCFRFAKEDETYTVIAHGKVLHLTQRGDEVRLYPCTAEEFESLWVPYFDLERDYAAIKQTLSADPILERAAAYAGGIRLVNQDEWECLLSFIISQNMNIPRIKQIVANLCEKYGTEIPSANGAYAFPTPAQLSAADIPALILCKTGFRAKYLADAIRKVTSGELDIFNTQNLPTAELRSKFLTIYGVGEKVADCAMLYSCGRYEVFPTDVWVKRIVQNLYFGGKDVPIKEIHAFAKEKFGALAGFAQQYLFHYARRKEEI